MTDEFAQWLGPLFHHTIEFQERVARGESPSLEGELAACAKLVEKARRRAAGAGRRLPADAELALRAVVYWIDETHIFSRWEHRNAWKNQILENRFFPDERGRSAAEAFYECLVDANQLPGVDAVEAYSLCLALGFRGRLRWDENELRAVFDHIHPRIAAEYKENAPFLPHLPRDLPPGELFPLPGRSWLLGLTLLASFTALTTLVGFILAVHAQY